MNDERIPDNTFALILYRHLVDGEGRAKAESCFLENTEDFCFHDPKLSVRKYWPFQKKDLTDEKLNFLKLCISFPRSDIQNCVAIHAGALLVWAASKGYSNHAIALVEAGACPSSNNSKAMCGLMYAAKHGDIPLARKLIAMGAQIGRRDKDRKTALLYAIEAKELEMVKFLIEKGSAVNPIRSVDHLPLSFAAYHSCPAIIQELLRSGAGVNRKDRNGVTALMVAAHNRSIECVSLLIENGADVSLVDSEGRTVMERLGLGRPKMLVELLKKAA